MTSSRNEKRRAERAAKRAATVAEYTERRDALKKRMAALKDTYRTLKAELKEAIEADQPLPPGVVTRVDSAILACDALYAEVFEEPTDRLVAYVAADYELRGDMNTLAVTIRWLDEYIGEARRRSQVRREARPVEPIQCAHG
jgi:hypothetical protein